MTEREGTAANALTRLRVASWNVNHWQRTIEQREAAWSYLQGEADVDIALLQETVPPSTIDRARVEKSSLRDHG